MTSLRVKTEKSLDYLLPPAALIIAGLIFWQDKAHQIAVHHWIDKHLWSIPLSILILVVASWLLLFLISRRAGLWVLRQVLGSVSLPGWLTRKRAKSTADLFAEWPQIAETVGLVGSSLVKVDPDNVGRTLDIELGRWSGLTRKDVAAQIDKLAVTISSDAREGSVRVLRHPSRLAGRVLIQIIDTDPLAQTIPFPKERIESVQDGLRLGRFETGEEVRLPFWTESSHPHGLVGGATGSGKSGIVKCIVANLISCRDVVVWVIDLKMIEFLRLESCLGRLATTQLEAVETLKALIRIYEYRKRELARQRLQDWVPSPENPLIVLVIDEVAQLDDDSMSDVLALAQLGRACAIQLILATQQPSARQLNSGEGSGTALRGQLLLRICMGVRGPGDGDLILGGGYRSDGWQPDRMLPHKGCFFISLEGTFDTARVARAYRLEPAAEDALALACAPVRPQLDAGSAKAEEEPDENENEATKEPTRKKPGKDAALWEALHDADSDGLTAEEMAKAWNKSLATTYIFIKEQTASGRLKRVGVGHYSPA